jgi:hypothetical protein
MVPYLEFPPFVLRYRRAMSEDLLFVLRYLGTNESRSMQLHFEIVAKRQIARV